MAENAKEYEKSKSVPPFLMWCSANIPTVFDDSLSYYEALCALYKFIQDNIISVVNNNADYSKELDKSFKTLKTYVDEYFKNLDVQGEINSKLDQMAESGQLANIIAQYIQMQGVLGYDSIAELKIAENVIDGSICRTLGDTTYNDGKGEWYKVRHVRSTDVIDDVKVVRLENFDELVAEKIDDYWVQQLDIKVEKLENTFNIDSDTTFNNEVAPTQMPFNSSNVITNITTNGSNPAEALISETTPNGTNVFEHNAYGKFIKSKIKGSGNFASPALGTGIGELINIKAESQYNGNISDWQGSVIGLASFAQADYVPNLNIVTALWGYPSEPEHIETNYDPAVVGIEINVNVKTDHNKLEYFGKGASVSFLSNNYQDANKYTSPINQSFGLVLEGTPIDGDYTHQDANHYHGYYTGILIDKIKETGIKFHGIFENNTVGIKFPDLFNGTTHPNVTGIAMGDSRLNYGNYIGSVFNNGDMWRNSGKLYYREGNVNHEMIMTDQPINRPIVLGVEATGNYPNNSFWSANNLLFFKDNSGTIHQITFAY